MQSVKRFHSCFLRRSFGLSDMFSFSLSHFISVGMLIMINKTEKFYRAGVRLSEVTFNRAKNTNE